MLPSSQKNVLEKSHLYPEHQEHSITSHRNDNSSSYYRNKGSSRGNFSLRRSLSRYSRKSLRSYVSNISSLNRKNLMRFGKSKVTFLVTNSLFTLYGLAAFIFSICTWTDAYALAFTLKNYANIVLIMMTVVSALVCFCGSLGLAGAFAHRKVILIIFLILLVPTFVSNVALGYIAYNERNGGLLPVKLSQKWDQLADSDKAVIESQFLCCGFLSTSDRVVNSNFCDAANSTLAKRQVVDPVAAPVPVATASAPAPAATKLPTFIPDPTTVQDIPANQQNSIPGCQATWGATVGDYLTFIYTLAFATIPLYLMSFVVGVLSTGHIYD